MGTAQLVNAQRQLVIKVARRWVSVLVSYVLVSPSRTIVLLSNTSAISSCTTRRMTVPPKRSRYGDLLLLRWLFCSGIACGQVRC